MKCRLILLILALCIFSAGYSQSLGSRSTDLYPRRFAYINKTKFSLREKPDKEAERVRVLLKYDMLELIPTAEKTIGWSKATFFNGQKSYTGYVGLSGLTPFYDDPMMPQQLDGKYLSLYDTDENNIAGYIFFRFDGNEFSGEFKISDPKKQTAETKGLIEGDDFTGSIDEQGRLTIYETLYPVVFDAEKNLLYAFGRLWQLHEESILDILW